MFIVKDAVREPLYAVVPYFNPWRWKTREKHTLRAIKHFADSGAVVILVEAAFNRREFTFADSGLHDTPANCNIHGEGKFRHQYIGLRTKDELWLKENLINVATLRLPHEWQQLCWLDSDVHFLRPNWVGETIHKLQHFKFLQMFSHACDVGPNYEMLPVNYPHSNGASFMHAYRSQDSQKFAQVLRGERKIDFDYYGGRVWPGLAWSCTRQAWDEVGGLLDYAIWGGGDWHMSHALIEKKDQMMRDDLHSNYQGLVQEWFDRCKRHIRRNVGVMDGTIVHNWHGKKVNRRYNEKHRILAQNGFDPLRHIKRDYQGLWQLHDDGSEGYVALRDLFRRVAHERNEDSNEI